MVKVTFLKDHLGFKTGDTTEVDKGIADYWERTGVAEAAAKEKKEQKVVAPKKEAKVITPKKEVKTASKIKK